MISVTPEKITNKSLIFIGIIWFGFWFLSQKRKRVRIPLQFIPIDFNGFNVMKAFFYDFND
ncbi:hypothetical protein BZG84_11640 [Salinivibrio sp. PR932]|nr:hypothetical protein BZG84_11640 [Salinivibrio sp. PR932]